MTSRSGLHFFFQIIGIESRSGLQDFFSFQVHDVVKEGDGERIKAAKKEEGKQESNEKWQKTCRTSPRAERETVTEDLKNEPDPLQMTLLLLRVHLPTGLERVRGRWSWYALV